MIKFCSECGVKLEYKFSPPKFCSNCGFQFGSVASASQSQPVREITKDKKIEAISDNETDAENVPRLRKLEYEIDTFADAKKTLFRLYNWRTK